MSITALVGLPYGETTGGDLIQLAAPDISSKRLKRSTDMFVNRIGPGSFMEDRS